MTKSKNVFMIETKLDPVLTTIDFLSMRAYVLKDFGTKVNTNPRIVGVSRPIPPTSASTQDFNLNMSTMKELHISFSKKFDGS